MAWSSRDFDPQTLSAAALSAVQQMLSKAATLVQSQEPKVEATPIVEYQGRMRAMGLEKMGVTCYVSVINFYLNQADVGRAGKSKGAMVLYMEIENAGKFFKGMELPFAEDEDDNSMMAACGQVAQKVAEALRTELTSKGYAPLVFSNVRNYKNNVVEGVEYSTDQKTKHELSFFYFKHKAIALDLTLASIPKK